MGPEICQVQSHFPLVTRGTTRLIQVNLGPLCDLCCGHCHQQAGPRRTEVMQPETASAVLRFVAGRSQVERVELTGGAPELSPCFRMLVMGARSLGRDVAVRTNLTAMERSGEELAPFLAALGVEIVASLPCHTEEVVDAQRGRGVFARSIAMLRCLNGLGYGAPGSPLRLDLVYNPSGTDVAPPQSVLEPEYRRQLHARHGVVFHHLLTLANLPLGRFGAMLAARGEKEAYLSRLRRKFNPATLPMLMCRSQLCVDWRGHLFDCDFAMAAGLGVGPPSTDPIRVDDEHALEAVPHTPVTTGEHCWACTAGAGTSCRGELVADPGS